MGPGEMRQIGAWMLTALQAPDNDAQLSNIRAAVAELCQSFPVPGLACEAV